MPIRRRNPEPPVGAIESILSPAAVGWVDCVGHLAPTARAVGYSLSALRAWKAFGALTHRARAVDL